MGEMGTMRSGKNNRRWKVYGGQGLEREEAAAVRVVVVGASSGEYGRALVRGRPVLSSSTLTPTVDIMLFLEINLTVLYV